MTPKKGLSSILHTPYSDSSGEPQCLLIVRLALEGFALRVGEKSREQRNEGGEETETEGEGDRETDTTKRPKPRMRNREQKPRFLVVLVHVPQRVRCSAQLCAL